MFRRIIAHHLFLCNWIIHAVADRRREPNEAPEPPRDYTAQAHLIAHVAVAKAGERLVGVLVQVVR